jgi:serine/threonine-protein kinase RsbT
MAVAMMRDANPAAPAEPARGVIRLFPTARAQGGADPAMPGAPAMQVPIASDSDVVAARQKARMLALRVGFSSADATIVATAISELARNVVLYAVRGEISVSLARRDSRVGITVTARDDGPGIPDVDQAMQDGYSSGGRLGVGLPGVRRLMDEFQISSAVGRGTTVTATKWKDL